VLYVQRRRRGRRVYIRRLTLRAGKKDGAWLVVIP
jgi:hypothetical protein